MRTHLIGYLLDALDEPTRHHVQQALLEQPQLRHDLEILRRALEPLVSDRRDEPPPPGLVERTLARIDAWEQAADELPSAAHGWLAPVSATTASITPENLWGGEDDREAASAWWSRPNVLVGIGVCCLILGLVAPMLLRVQHTHQIQLCQNNLRMLHQGVISYAAQHEGRFPMIAQEAAGATQSPTQFMHILHDQGYLPSNPSFACPDAVASTTELGNTYAYPLGYRDEAGRLHGFDLQTASDWTPLAADLPASHRQGKQSGGPHGHGQNVLFFGGQVRFCNAPTVGFGGDDIYRNLYGQVQAGITPWDSVLAGADARP